MHRDQVAIRVRAWPLELVNGERVPPEVLTDEVAELRRTVAPDLFTAFNPELFPMSSLPALALAATAYRTDPKRGERVSLALREALFEDGRDVADPDELLRIGDVPTGNDIRAGEADVRADYAEGRARGVIGSPHFFVDGEAYFCPTLSIERVDGALSVSFDAEAFDEFIGRCFG
jgi:2-hydroxychromene-2-carboxylate isomerase